MQNLTTLKTVLFAALLTVPALSASAQCPGGGACPQAVEDCACPAQMGSGEDCACPQVKTIETRQPGGCIQAASKNGDCGEAKPVAYTLEPRSDEFKMSARQQLFSESAEEKEDRDGSIFGGGPCVSCDKNGSIFGGGPCKTCDKNGSIFGGAPCNGPACRPEKTNPKYIQNYILSNYNNANLNLAGTARSFNVSEGYLSSAFKETMGICFAEYLENIRIEKSCELLRSSAATIVDIAEKTGYNSVYSFRRAFKRLMHISPSDYRTRTTA